ncbi:adenosine deaminase [Candidatus Berkiella cookevillensis]|uniref:Adenosine deaminase n=1 Tax=Candidatus Berkiella cookevillensis TaxID=437022 RepID=A0A0Q9YR22_9GAMM|nr:adenosine deaminase [Candidatus Berkiella cookevillensis]MCS5709318.1 adenosine deaminase [Candidatus Berkiella cookevillensis]
MTSFTRISLEQLPKAELHVHLEGGTLRASKLIELADKHGLPKPTLIFGENNNLKFADHDFLDFLKVYDLAASYILTEQDIEEVTYEYLEQCAKQGTLYVELTCSPDHVTQNRKTYTDIHQTLAPEQNTDLKAAFRATLARALQEKYKTLPNIDYAQFIAAVVRGIDRANAQYGIEARILIVLLRHNGKEHCHTTIQNMLDYPHPYVVGINLAGNETDFPPTLFVEHYQKAKKAGYKLTAHVGEHTGAEYIKEAVDILALDRIGHGTSAFLDTTLIATLVDKKIGIEANITSNLALTNIKDVTSHPFKLFLDADILVSLNTDDPTYFNTDIGREYEKAKSAWNLKDEDLLKITRNAIQSAFCEVSLKTKLLASIDLYEAARETFKHVLALNDRFLYSMFMKYLLEATQPSLETYLRLQAQNPKAYDCKVLVQKHIAYEQACEQHNKYIQSTKMQLSNHSHIKSQKPNKKTVSI